MRIGLIQTNLGIFGSTRRTIELGNALVAAGHDVCIFTRTGEGSSWLTCHAKVAGINRLPDTYDVLAVLTADRTLFDRADQAEAGVRFFYLLGLGEQRLAEIKQELSDPTSSALAAAIHSDKWRLIANSTWQAWWIESNFDKPCPVVFGGLNRSIFYRPEHVIKPKFVVGYSGDPRQRKGTDDVKSAIALARPYVPSITSQSYHDKNIPQARLADWYAGCTIFVDGQKWAGWNNPVIEAMACGTPVVCTDIGGVRDFAKHKMTAWVVPTDNVPLLADGIINLLSDPALRRILADNALTYVSRFTWEASAAQFLAAMGG